MEDNEYELNDDPIVTELEEMAFKTIRDVINKLRKSQVDLDPDVAKVLYDNLWDLYEE